MASKLQEEIKQTRPFGSIEEEALLNIRRTSDRLQYHGQQLFKPHGITPTQYNVLRILRGAGDGGLRCSDIGERLVSSDPDITRLLGRLQIQKLIKRKRNPKDRRVIYATITAQGLNLLKELDPIVSESTRQVFRHMDKEKLQTLISLLEEARQAISE
ncbi:MAG TPA: MarR family transcriptional regulator [Alloacidobacterium sp.]|jgi:DNA-binding MarR family transcriptional regulator|nr:MarR family transcriptional regulator [Alloacidobacterium sp.]